MKVHVYNEQSDLPIKRDEISPIVALVFEGEQFPCDEIAINFIEEEASGALHEEHFGDPAPTDCMTFPLNDGPYHYVGDLFICPAVAIAYAIQHDCKIYEEVTLYLIHGLLHLCGYGDLEAEERIQMRAAEERYLSQVKKLDLWLRG